MHIISTLLARMKRRAGRNRPLRGRVVRRETLAEYSGQGRATVRVEAVTYATGANRIVKVRA